MALTAISQRNHTDGVIGALTAAGIAVGRGVRIDDTGAEIPPPCAVVHPLPGGDRDGTIDDWTQNAELVYQITCVGETAAAAEQVRDDVEAAMLTGVTVPDRLIDVIRIDFGSDQVRRDDDIGQPDLYFSAMPRYRLYSVAE